METVNHECYVSLEVAKILKKAGFDWESETCYIGKSKKIYKYDKYFNWNMPRKDFEKGGSDNLFYAFINQKKTTNFVSTPTLDVAQRWLREVKNTHIEISPNSDMSAYIYNILLHGDKFWLGSPISYITYEEAQEAGINKALEKILEKGE